MSAMPTTTTLGLIEAFDRHGALRLTDARHPLLSVLPQGEPV